MSNTPSLEDVHFTGYEYTLFCSLCQKNHWQWAEWPGLGYEGPSTVGDLTDIVDEHLDQHAFKTSALKSRHVVDED